MPTHTVEAPNGDIFVSDGYGQNLIHRFSAKNEHLLTFGGGDSVFIPQRFNLGPVTGTPGTDLCQFNGPHELLVTADHRVYVMDRENHRWQVFTTDGEFVSLQEHVSYPNRVALDADGTFHIAVGTGIEIWKRDWTKIGSWSEKGEAPGQFVAGSVHGGRKCPLSNSAGAPSTIDHFMTRPSSTWYTATLADRARRSPSWHWYCECQV
jgi:hypothetical protein